MKKREAVREDLQSFMEQMQIVDSHEHLEPESVHLERSYTFFHLLMPYVKWDLYSAGMPRSLTQNPNTPTTDEEADRAWKVIRPFWPHVKQGSYARVVLEALKEFWGIDDITDDNYREIGQLLRDTRREGHYDEILRRKCRIKWILNQPNVFATPNDPLYSYREPYMKGCVSGHWLLLGTRLREFLNKNPNASLDDYAQDIFSEIDRGNAAGAVLCKFCVSYAFYKEVDEKAAREEFERFKKDPNYNLNTEINPYLADCMLTHLGKIGMVAAIHTGVWHDIRDRNPERLFSVIPRHPDVTFDVYHMGIPYVHECGFLAKNCHNAYLNLCWSHIVAPQMVIRAVDEYLDYIPVNKFFGFGGELYIPELVWGHRKIAFENLAEIFTRRIERGSLDLDGAKHILKLWLYDNPARVYRLEP